MKPLQFNSSYHIPLLSPLLLTGSACGQMNSDSDFWEGVALADRVCTSYSYDSTSTYAYGYYQFCNAYEEVVLELPYQYRYNYLGIYRYTGFANYVLEFTPNYAIFSYIYHYTYAVLFFDNNYDYTTGFSNMFPYTKEQNTYRISIPFSNEDMTCRQEETFLSCTGIEGFSRAIAYQKSRKANLEQYLHSL